MACGRSWRRRVTLVRATTPWQLDSRCPPPCMTGSIAGTERSARDGGIGARPSKGANGNEAVKEILRVDVVHRDNVDKQTLEWWDSLCRETTLAMQDHLMRYVTPISVTVSSEGDLKTEGRLQGTGSYILWGGRRLLMTNEHILRNWRPQQCGHQFQGCDKIFQLNKPLGLEGDPVDAAICVIADQLWEQHGSGAEAIPQKRIAER